MDRYSDGVKVQKGWHYVRARVHNAVGPGTYTNLDLSAWIQKQRAQVLLIVHHAGGSSIYVRFRPGGSSFDPGTASNILTSNIPVGYASGYVVDTSESGIVEWKTSDIGVTIQIWLEGFTD